MREALLARIREALQDAQRTHDVPRDYREQQTADDDVVELFIDRVEDYRAVVVRCTSETVEQAIVAAVGESSVVVPHGFPYRVADAQTDESLSHQQLDQLDGAVTTATVGIARTGTVVLDHGPGQGRRALTLIPDLHICVVRASQIVPDVPEAVAMLDPSRPQTWISGPSATSDIELSRVEGVHGPRTLHVIVVDDT